jgi:hypothetical protein
MEAIYLNKATGNFLLVGTDEYGLRCIDEYCYNGLYIRYTQSNIDELARDFEFLGYL